jgi:putative ribosome biogenesis GTPase RsgA
MQEGIVLSAPGGIHEVLVGDQLVQCSWRRHIIEADERHRAETKEMPYVDLVAAGDRVRISSPGTSGGRGYIEEILPRSTRFGRTRMDGWRSSRIEFARRIL